MQSFIAQTWEHLSTQVEDISTLRCIVPSIRAGNFLRQTIQAQHKGSGFLPEIIPIEHFIQDVADLRIIDELPLYFECYQVYLNTHKQDPKDDFETFSSWAGILLADFNEIDRYLVPPKSFFDYLSGIQQINHWSLSESPTALMAAYLNFWVQLHDYYQALKEQLLEKRLGYQGLVYREATQQLTFYLDSRADQPHAFIGFNALNNAEQFIFQEFLATGDHYVYWDADAHFIKDSSHSASLFMRRYFTTWPHYQSQKPLFIGNNYNFKKEINLIEASTPLDQVKEIGVLLANLTDEQCKNTAVVLADEELLIPLLNSLPASVQAVNVTMGVSLKYQPLTQWLILLLDLHINHPKSFYYKPLFAILKHPVIDRLVAGNQQLMAKMISQNRIAITYQEILGAGHSEDKLAYELLFSPWPLQVQPILNRLKEILSLFANLNNPILRTTATKLHEVVLQMDNMQQRYHTLTDLETVRTLLRQLSAKYRLDYEGDAYSGLQIMGVLESRALDFDRVIIASVNEGHLPSGKNAPSYITSDMKLQYDLPSYYEKDAIYTYHFYRLLHRVSEAHILYTAVGGGFQSKEESRLIKQLRNQTDLHTINQRTLQLKMKTQPVALRVLEKTKGVGEKLNQLAVKGYSPSTLTNYIRNPIDFYTRKVLGIRQAEQLEEDIELNTLGSIVHQTIEQLYKPFVGTFLKLEDLKSLLPQTRSKLSENSLELLGPHYLLGKNRIIIEVAHSYVQYAIKSDMRLLDQGSKVELLAIEKPLSAALNHPVLGVINLHGIADRVDRLNGNLRIIDYKTGKVEPGQLKLSDWELLNQEYKFGKAFQVLMYAYMFTKQEGVLPNTAGIISFRMQSKDYMAFGWQQPGTRTTDEQLTASLLQDFEQNLLNLFDEIYNLNIPFTEKEV